MADCPAYPFIAAIEADAEIVALVAAPAKLTGVDFGAVASGSVADIRRAWRRSREWSVKNGD